MKMLAALGLLVGDQEACLCSVREYGHIRSV